MEDPPVSAFIFNLGSLSPKAKLAALQAASDNYKAVSIRIAKEKELDYEKQLATIESDWAAYRVLHPITKPQRVVAKICADQAGNDQLSAAVGSYLEAVGRFRTEAQKLIESFYFKHESRRDFKKMYIEDKSSGSSMLQVFNSRRMKVEAIQRNIDKEQRANIFGGFIEMGKVYLNTKVPNITHLTDEAISFPNGVHDDTIDPMLDAIEKYCVGNNLSAWENLIW